MLSLVNEEAAAENLDPVEAPEEEDDIYSPDEDMDEGIQFTEVKNVPAEETKGEQPEQQVKTSFYLDKKGNQKSIEDAQLDAVPELKEQVKEIIKNNEENEQRPYEPII